jgi:hypothetical protein
MTTTRRGYGWQHQQARAAYLRAWGNRPCVRCGEAIAPGQPVDLDHTDDRRGYNGIAHAACNRSAAGRKSQALRVTDPEPQVRTDW